MHSFAQKPKPTQEANSANSVRPHLSPSRRSSDVHRILHLQRTIGNQAVRQMLQADVEKSEVGSVTTTPTRYAQDFSRISAYPPGRPAPPTLKPKLTLNTPGDGYEREADHIANTVMSMSEPELTCGCDDGCPNCKNKHHHHKHLQPKRVRGNYSGDMVVTPGVHEVLRSSGQSLDADIRTFMEPRFGHDFSRVQVHSDRQAAEAATTMNARAFTVGGDIVFGAGQYRPGTGEGRRLIAHELTHVLQQSGEKKAPVQMLQAQPAPPEKSNYECEKARVLGLEKIGDDTITSLNGLQYKAVKISKEDYDQGKNRTDDDGVLFRSYGGYKRGIRCYIKYIPNIAPKEKLLRTGPIQVTLRWNTTDDLDLAVTDPLGNVVNYINPNVASGGELDVDSNENCTVAVAAPVENIIWNVAPPPPNGGYQASVILFTRCAGGAGAGNPINFTLTIRVQGVVVNVVNGAVNDGGNSITPFNFP